MNAVRLGCMCVGSVWLCSGVPVFAMDEAALRDSMLTWLQRGDLAAWSDAGVNEPDARSVLAGWGLEDFSTPSEAEWRWMQLGAQRLAVVNKSALDRDPVKPEDYLAQRTSREALPWWWACGVLAGAGAVGLLWAWRERRKFNAAAGEVARSPVEAELAAFATAPFFQPVPFPDAAWQAFLAEDEMEPISARWALLNASERECAKLLSQGVSVADIAVQLACSPSYVYNIRSSIRKKWDLAGHQDVVAAIAAELQREG